MDEFKSTHLDHSRNLSGISRTDYPLDFDYQSTTPCEEKVLEAMEPYWTQCWGNASNKQNRLGSRASAALSLARESLASCLGVAPERVIFTSGATEANNLALLGCARARAVSEGKPGHLITLATEHRSVLEPLRHLVNEGFELTEMKPDSNGLISADQLSRVLRDNTFIVSIMMANNEIGVIQPIKDLAELCKRNNITFHSDAAQAFGNLPLSVDHFGIDLMSISSHKIYGPKGIGVLVTNNNTPLIPLQFGGGQEQGLRSGTLPLPLVVGMAKAAELAMKDLEERNMIFLKLRDKFLEELEVYIPDLLINGSLDQRLSHNINITIPGIRGNRLIKGIRPFIHCSSGSACSNGASSHVLLALGRTLKEAEASLRLSFGRKTTYNDIDELVKILSKEVIDLKTN